MTDALVASPCISICRMHEPTGWCEGCLRTLDEIAFWSVLDEDDKRAVCSQLDQRRVEWHRLRVALAPGVDATGAADAA